MQQAKEEREGIGPANAEYEAEAVIAEVAGINTGIGHASVGLEAMAVLTTAAGTAETTLRIRREGLTGTAVLAVTVKPGASTKVSIPLQVLDTPPGELAGGKYVLTAQESAAAKGKSVESRLSATF